MNQRSITFAVAFGAFVISIDSICAAAERSPHAQLVDQVLSHKGSGLFDLLEAPGEGSKEKDARNEIMQSENMRVAIAWLEEFFAVSAEFNDQQVNKFYAVLTRMSSRQLLSFLEAFARVRTHLDQLRVADEQNRQQLLALYPRSRIEPPPSGRADHGAPWFFSHYGQMGVAGGIPVTRPFAYGRYRVARPPLVTSLDAARFLILQGFWRVF